VRFDDPLDDVFRGPGHVRVLRALTGLPAAFPVSGREIARRAGVSHTTALSVLGGLVAQGLVRVHRAHWGDGYELNNDHVLAGTVVEAFELEGSIRQIAIEFLSNEIRSHAPAVAAAYVFGSAAWGEMEPASDVDLAVICSRRDREDVETGMRRIAEAFRVRFGNELSVLIKTVPGPAAEFLAKGTTARGPKLWARILREGIPVVLPQEIGTSSHG
jgi:predicted nucleotidyltransferase